MKTIKKQNKCIILPNELADKINSLLEAMGASWWSCGALKALMKERNFPYIPYMPTKLHREQLVAKRSGKYMAIHEAVCTVGCAGRVLKEVRLKSEQCSRRYRELKASKIKTLQANKVSPFPKPKQEVNNLKIASAIAFLKDNGFKVLRQISKWEEV